jgi:FtsP/CotA-like multicopper oxidase with cupredoxin domain
MFKYFLFPFVFILFLFGPGDSEKSTTATTIGKRVISCAPGKYYTLANLPRIKHPRLIYPDEPSAFPKVIANDNRVPAGKMQNNVLELELEIMWSDFYPETDNRPGLRLVAIAEKGKAPSIPAPLIRVEAGTKIHIILHNTLKDSTANFFGLEKRPSSINGKCIELKPGETKEISFESGAAGTYLYNVRLGSHNLFEFDGEEDQLSGAFIIDPKGGSPPDRVFVINIYSAFIDTSLFKNGSLESLTINGKSWPFTEQFFPSVGDTMLWRVVNSSIRMHPMHLHGFNFTVLSKGSLLSDHIFEKSKRPVVVTEDLYGGSTMIMKWVAARPGTWLFHCHLSFHVVSDIRLPGMSSLDPPEYFNHMAGLVLGITVKPGASDLISKGEPKNLDLYANEYSDSGSARNGFSLSPDFKPDNKIASSPGPLLVLKQFQPTFITVNNRMSSATAVHWHGLEIDSWADGVPGWSASDGKSSPSIQPGEKFTYKLTLLHPGTFIYHSHLDDIYQITHGLYGPLIVMGENETYDPKTDHFYIVAWKNDNPQKMQELELNGSYEQPVQYAYTGESHRLRLMNIEPAGSIKIRVEKDGKPILIKFIAKDGIDLPAIQQILIKESPFFGVGETADFLFKPKKAGVYNLHVSIEGEECWNQIWIVKDK